MDQNISVHKLEPDIFRNFGERSLLPKAKDVFIPPGLISTGVPGGHSSLKRAGQQGKAENKEADAKHETPCCSNEELLQRAEKLLLPCFVHNDLDHPAVQEIFRLAGKRLAKTLAGDPKTSFAPVQRIRTRRHGEILFGKNQALIKPADQMIVNLNELELLPLPGLVQEMQKAMVDPKCTAATLAGIMEQYPGISRRLLKVVNSSFYSLPIRIDSVFQAAAILGIKRLSMLVLGLTIRSVFKEVAPSSMDMKKFWRHSMACAIASKTMGAARMGLNNERLFLAGLLHDIGRLILMKNHPEYMRLAEKKAVKERKAHYFAEAEVLGLDHAEVGGLLVSRWKFSLVLEQIISCHHEPSLSVHPVETAIVHVADILANVYTLDMENEEYVPPLDPYAWELLKLDPAVFAPCLRRIDRVLEQKQKNSNGKSGLEDLAAKAV